MSAHVDKKLKITNFFVKKGIHLKLKHPIVRPRFLSKLFRERCLIDGHTSGTNTRDKATHLVKVDLAIAKQSPAKLRKQSETSS